MSTSIFDIAAYVASKFSAPLGPPTHGLAAASILHILTQLDSPSSRLIALHPTLKASFNHEASTPPRLYLASMLTPYRHVTYKDPKGKVHFAAEAAIREGVKLGVQNHYLDGIPALFASADLLQNRQIDGDKERLRMGKVPHC